MKRADLFPDVRSRQRKEPACRDLFTPEQALANMELLKQELAGLERGANSYFCGFSVPPVNGKPAQWRAWLLQGAETLEDLKPTQVDFVLKNLDWFKEQIAKKQVVFDDELPWL